MKEIKVKDIIETTNGKLIAGDENENLKNFKKDTREINLGDTYVRNKRRKSRWKYAIWKSIWSWSKSMHNRRHKNRTRKVRKI